MINCFTKHIFKYVPDDGNVLVLQLCYPAIVKQAVDNMKETISDNEILRIILDTYRIC